MTIENGRNWTQKKASNVQVAIHIEHLTSHISARSFSKFSDCVVVVTKMLHSNATFELQTMSVKFT